MFSVTIGALQNFTYLQASFEYLFLVIPPDAADTEMQLSFGDSLATLWRLATLCPRSGDALSMLWRLAMLWQRSGHALTLERRSYTLPCALKLFSLNALPVHLLRQV